MLDKILESCKYVSENIEHIKINYDVLDSYIQNMNSSKLKHWLSSNPYDMFSLEVSDVVNLLLLIDSVNYSYWGNPKWTIDTNLGKKDGSDALLYLFLKYVKETNTLDFSKVTLLEFRDMLKGNVDIPFLVDRYNTLVSVSSIVNDKMNGNFYKYVKDLTNDIDLFNLIIENFSSFKDERFYKGKTIYFYKLAQLLTSDILHIRETIEGIKADYSHLLGCADYKIPQTLRALNIISYDDELSYIVDNKILIKESSVYEVEIRASMMVVIDYIKNKLGNVNSIDVNDYFFVASKSLKDNIKPYHLCRNKNY